MKKFVCIRTSRIARRGDWFLAEDVGEPLFRAQVVSGPRGSHIAQISRVGIPFHELAPSIVEPGFSIPRSMLKKIENLSQAAAAREIADFQSSNSDIIEPEIEERGRKNNPTLQERARKVRRGKIPTEPKHIKDLN